MNKRRWGVLGVCGAILLFLFLVTLIPIGLVSAYDRMDFDDYDYSVLTRAAVRNDGSAFGLLRAAGQTVSETYQTWQGTYSAVFLFSLQPAIWGQGWYALTSWILIGTLVFGLGCFTFAVLVVALRQDRRVWLLVWMLASILCVQFPRDPSEGFFWYNGGMFYTFFFGLLLIWLALIIDLANREQPKRAGTLLRSIALILLSGIVAGGNYPTALLLGVLLVGYLLWSIRNRKAILPALILSLVVYFAGFALNVLAPGKRRSAGAAGAANADSRGWFPPSPERRFACWGSFCGIPAYWQFCCSFGRRSASFWCSAWNVGFAFRC